MSMVAIARPAPLTIQSEKFFYDIELDSMLGRGFTQAANVAIQFDKVKAMPENIS